jgi:hypothetical protein
MYVGYRPQLNKKFAPKISQKWHYTCFFVTFSVLGRFETAHQPNKGWHFPLFFPLNCRWVYGIISIMSQKTADYSLNPQIGNRQQATGNRQQAIILIV